MAEKEPEKEKPTHDPYELRILPMVLTAQAANGLRHDDHHRYRKYCYRRLAHVRKRLKFHHGRGRYKPNPFPEYISTALYLELPLVCAERAWAYGMQIKADLATQAGTAARARHHSVNRFKKATIWAKELVKQCQLHCDARSVREAEAYEAFLRCVLATETEKWKEAKEALTRATQGWEQLAMTAEKEDQKEMYREKLKELSHTQRLITYHLGGTQAEGEKLGIAADMEVLYRGKTVPVASKSLQTPLREALKLLDLDAKEEDVLTTAVEKYGERINGLEELQKKVHGCLVDAELSAEERQALALVNHSLSEASQCANAERSLALLRTLGTTLNADAKKQSRPDDGVRLCDVASEELGRLLELPEAAVIEEGVSLFLQEVKNQRCFFMALTLAQIGKVAEAISLFDLLLARGASEPSPAPIENLQRVRVVLQDLSAALPGRVSLWRSRILAQHAKAERGGSMPTDAEVVSTFPPKVQVVACKPFVLDLAHEHIEAPSFEELIKAQEKQGIAGALGGGLKKLGGAASKVGGWFGRG